MFRSSEGPLGVNDPVVVEQDPQPCSEGARLSTPMGKKKDRRAEIQLE
jgi:hypothetical protein